MTHYQFRISGLCILLFLGAGSALHAQDVALHYEKTSDWGLGYKAEITLHNRGATPVTEWTLDFDSTPTITRIWNASMVREGTRYTLQDNGWNATLAPGDSAVIGLEGRYHGAFQYPEHVRINGAETAFVLTQADLQSDVDAATAAGLSEGMKDGTQAFFVQVFAEEVWPGTDRLAVRLTSRSLNLLELRKARFSFVADMAYEYALTVFEGPSWGQTNVTVDTTEQGYRYAFDFTFGDEPWIVSRMAFGESIAFEFFAPQTSDTQVVLSTARAAVPDDLVIQFGDASLTLQAPPVPEENVAHITPVVTLDGPFAFRESVALAWGQDTTLTALAYGRYDVTVADVEQEGFVRYPGGTPQIVLLSEVAKDTTLTLGFGAPEYFAMLRVETPAAPVASLPAPTLVVSGPDTTMLTLPWGRTTAYTVRAETPYQAWTKTLGFNDALFESAFTVEAPFVFQADRGNEVAISLAFETRPDTTVGATAVRLDMEGLPEGVEAGVRLTSDVRMYQASLGNGMDLFFADVVPGAYTLRGLPVVRENATTYLARDVAVAVTITAEEDVVRESLTYDAITPVRDAFTPFVDASAFPFLDMEAVVEESGVDKFILGFIVNDADLENKPCSPTWGGFGALPATSAAADSIGEPVHLLADAQAVRAQGGGIMLSFGGAINVPIAATCEDVDSLVEAYEAIIDTYNIYQLDFDVEGVWVDDPVSIERRSLALAELQKRRPAVTIWLTLPVTPNGLNADAEAVVASALEAGVILDGINVMTFDFGAEAAPDPSILDVYVKSSLTRLHAQVEALYADAGITQSSQDMWRLLGGTTMIGVNDVVQEVFTLDHAREVLAFAEANQLGRLSMWSINRDQPCPDGPQPDAVFPNCSSIEQEPLAFAEVFNVYTTAGSDANARVVTNETIVSELPEAFGLGASYPNPFNPTTIIPYHLPKQSAVRLDVFDMVGRRVQVLVDTVQPAGSYEVRFTARALASGTYLYRLVAGEYVQTRRMVLLK